MSEDAERERSAHLETELGRAYRALQAFANAESKGELLTRRTFTYHSATIAAAKRFVFEGNTLDGADYFEGKPVEVLHAALRLPEK